MKFCRPPYKIGSRAARFLAIRDAILPHVPRMQKVRFGKALSLGPYLIHFSPPNAHWPGSGYNINIWPDGVRERSSGHVLHGLKVVNVYWNQRDELQILGFRGGSWEAELLELLTAAENVSFVHPR